MLIKTKLTEITYMARKGILIVIMLGIVLVLAAGAFMLTRRRQHMMGGSQSQASGGLVAVSADGNQLPDPAAAGELPENAAAQQAGDLLVTFAISPYPPTAYQQSTFEVTLADASGKPVDDATISLDLTMPEMPMPPNDMIMQSLSNGKYQSTGRFTMRGWWRIEVIIARGGAKQSVFFDVWL
jgi:hypothetical protein